MTRQIIHRGKKFDLALDSRVLPDGRAIEREVILHAGAVVMLPLVDAGHVCLVRNYRFSVEDRLLELPAGTLVPPESPESAAARELAEETGYSARQWRKLAEFFPSPGIMNERMHLFVVQDLTPGPTHLDVGEDIQTVILPWADALRLALDGTIRDAKTLVGLLLWDKMRGRND